MSTEHKINDTTKWGLLILAILFDLFQFISAGFMDLAITGFALITFALIFFEKGALTTNASGALRFFRFIVPFAEFFISHLPGITLQVWIMIEISRISDDLLPDVVKKSIRIRRLSKKAKDLKSQGKRTIKQGLKYAYGKGKRGARTLARKNRV